jgi:hypothetical protein
LESLVNSTAVEAVLKMGGKIVWFPTFHAQNQIDKLGDKDLVLPRRIQLFLIFVRIVKFNLLIAHGIQY